MAISYHTLGYRFAKSIILAKTYILHLTGRPCLFIDQFSEQYSGQFSGLSSPPSYSFLLDSQYTEQMETPRLLTQHVPRLVLWVQYRYRLLPILQKFTRGCLFLVEEVRLLLNPLVLNATTQAEAEASP